LTPPAVELGSCSSSSDRGRLRIPNGGHGRHPLTPRPPKQLGVGGTVADRHAAALRITATGGYRRSWSCKRSRWRSLHAGRAHASIRSLAPRCPVTICRLLLAPPFRSPRGWCLGRPT